MTASIPPNPISRNFKLPPIDSVNIFGVTGLHMSVQHSKMQSCQNFLEWGANPNTIANDGESPLDTAERIGNQEMIALLLSWNAKRASEIQSNN